ncbi:hypothetical protein T07_13274 [Trichinella nelsoni]|uniref:Uncharacterized protein n=1 Tax=Trichinella nelsoni TaxID=6336 RepID=A0A0V0RE80_9BILA|nr:hypothetical protein T07_13274 [Trichinella nelsoni]
MIIATNCVPVIVSGLCIGNLQNKNTGILHENSKILFSRFWPAGVKEMGSKCEVLLDIAFLEFALGMH